LSEAIKKIVATDGVNGVTRKELFDQLAKNHDFNAGGMIGTTDIGNRITTNCYVLTQVKNGKFVRVTPPKQGTFDCKKRNRLEIKLDLIK
jgi:hypothetical protein